MVEPQAVANEVEALPRDREGRAGQHHGGDLVEQFIAQHRPNLDGRAAEFHPVLVASREFDPVHRRPLAQAQPRFETRRNGQAPLRRRLQFDLFRFAGQPVGERRKRAAQVAQRGDQVGGDRRGGVDPAILATVAGPEFPQFGEQVIGDELDLGGQSLGLGELVMNQQSAVRLRIEELVQQVVNLPAGNLQPQVFGGDLLDGVGLVEDHDVIVGQQAPPLAAEGQVGEEQGVVDHQQIAIPDPPSGLVIQAVVVGRAALPQAVAMVAANFVPDFALRAEFQRGQAAIGGDSRPLDQSRQLVDLGGVGEQRVGPLGGVLEPAETDVIPPSLDQHRRELKWQNGVEEREVAGDELFLQADGVGRDDNPGAIRLGVGATGRIGGRLAGGGGEDGGDKVGEAFARARPRLNHQVLAVGDGVRDRLRHGQLLGAVFVGGQPLGDPPLRAENSLRGQWKRHAGPGLRGGERRWERTIMECGSGR